ncbi:sulfurtransferase complex subunit TusC [Buchnera aphidicola (Acyrthosiphon lactucae)]|uniref:Sulfurtransferase complex subunit TusC n=1 Tax=Buchnera aphidicola (Acyrthosiphon lactucae) TaxID=1241832 RepID=A0A4D6XT18_9GAMM|nr:sulfurtransferase complex subunit TusC [Buchnera aphidicola]QCI17908.1 sulfurtransferase complex subunit TusC [Buchnera aphidicola (Acyrthosiphon lactucae)]
MKIVAFVFSHSPHGTSFGREGLDAIFSLSSVFKKISLFFIGDGILQLIKSHQTENILARNYISSFSILSFYNIKDFYCCKKSLIERGFNSKKNNFILNVDILDSYIMRLKLDNYDAIINF